MEKIVISTEYIKLQQALKLFGAIGQGSDVKLLLSQKTVFVNGIIAQERGKKIRPGDIVEIKGFGKFQLELQ